jgi:hypothetical protein
MLQYVFDNLFCSPLVYQKETRKNSEFILKQKKLMQVLIIISLYVIIIAVKCLYVS